MSISAGAAFGLMWVGFAAYLGVLAAAPALGRRIVWALIALAVTAFAVAPVLLSHDVYSYVDYARLGVVHGLDPYVHPPLAAPTDPAFAEVTWTEATSAYGPLFTLATYPLAWLPVGVAVAVLKAVAALSVLGLTAVVARLAAWRGIDPLRAAAFVALNPLVLVHVVGGAHNDGLTMLLALLSVGAVLSARELSAGATLLAAIATKSSALFLAPFALLATSKTAPMGRNVAPGSTYRPIGRLFLGAALAAGVICGAAYLAFGWDWLSAFGLAGENQGRTSHMSIPITVARITGLDPDAVRVVTLVLFLTLSFQLLLWTWRGFDWVRAAAWTAAGLLLATSWLLPWYLVWLLPLAAISRDRPLQILALALTAYQLGARIPL
ncbi:MAG TPA: polyprenol phosphomannose-dependent alpha 1,6 mannosyltransferase MptB [Solirubrobacterales bacterium]|nr:polyprenol phosphomannose-dependent alpha 1,6 mannosyltransferase MptB [Solirubrobacterales bacterium]